MLRVRKLLLFDQDGAAMSEGEGAEKQKESKRSRARGWREAGPCGGGCWRGLRRLKSLQRQVCVGASNVHSDAGGHLDNRTRVQTWAVSHPHMGRTRVQTWAVRPRPTSVHICQTVTVLETLSVAVCIRVRFTVRAK